MPISNLILRKETKMTRQDKEDFLEEEGYGNGGWLAEQTDDSIDSMYESAIKDDDEDDDSNLYD